MLCRMCLLESENTLCIFEQDSAQFKIAPTIGRHFWFEPAKDDPVSIMICISCWSKIVDFHTYYLSVEEAQRLLAEYSSVKEEESAYSVEQLKSEYGDEYVDKKDEDIVNETSKPVEARTETDTAANCPVFVDVDVDDSDDNSDDPIRDFDDEGNYDDFEDDKEEDSDSCSSDEEPLAKKVVRKRVEHVDVKSEPEKPRRGRKKGSKNKPKNVDSNTTIKVNIKAEKDSAESQPSISTDNDSTLPIKVENDMDASIKLEINCDIDQSDRTDDPPKKKRGRKKKSEMNDETERVVKKPGDSEYRKKNKEYDDEISQFLRLQCELCFTDCETFADVKRHYRTTHNRRGYVVCCTTRKFYKRVFLYEHIQKHKNPDTFKCHFCDKVYCSASVLRSHLLTHDASFEKLYQCDKCPRRFAKLSVLNHHKIIHIPKEEHSFSCDICGKSFPSKNTMQTHRKSVHEKAYSKMCHICAKVINGKTLFAKHQLEHIGIVDPKMQCDQCGMWLKNAFRLKIHTKKHHSEENTGEHICNICGKVSSSSVGLKSHIRYVHSAQRKFLCSVCEKGFKTALNLKEHMTTHTGDILYTCPHCPKTFNSSANMHSHRKKMHRQEWEDSRRSRGLPVNTKGKRVIQIIHPEDGLLQNVQTSDGVLQNMSAESGVLENIEDEERALHDMNMVEEKVIVSMDLHDAEKQVVQVMPVMSVITTSSDNYKYLGTSDMNGRLDNLL